MIPTLKIDGVTVISWSQIKAQPDVFPKNDIMLVVFPNEGGIASQEFPKATTINRTATLTDMAGKEIFQGWVIDLEKDADNQGSWFKMTCAGMWYQFTETLVSSYECLQDTPLIYEDYEKTEPDLEDDYKYTGLINAISTTDVTDDNKAWDDTGSGEWAAVAGKHGIRVVKNLERPCTTLNTAQASETSGANTDTWCNNNKYYEAYETLYSNMYTEMEFTSAIARANHKNLKVRMVLFNEFKGGSGAAGAIEIYNYGMTTYDALIALDSEGLLVDKMFERTAAGALLEPDGATNKYMDMDGTIKLKITPGYDSRYSSPLGRYRIYYTRVIIAPTDYPTLEFGIDSNSTDTLTLDTDVSGEVDVLDFYQIGLRSDYVLNDLITTYDTWGALTVNGLTAGVHFLIKNWTNEFVSWMIKYAIAIEKYDMWINNDTKDVKSQDSTSATASGLSFDATTPNLQFIGFRGAILGSQIKNRVYVEWREGTVCVSDATSQTTYLYYNDYLHVDHSILGSEEATAEANRILARFKQPQTDITFQSLVYKYYNIGEKFTVNLPQYGISSDATYVLRSVSYDFQKDGTVVINLSLAKVGSTIHRYLTDIEDALEKAHDLRVLQQSLNTQTIPFGANLFSSHPFLDEDDLVSDNEDALASQQSIKAYVDGQNHLTIAEAKAALISDAAYGAGWDGVTDIAPSKNAVYDTSIALIAYIDGQNHLTGAQAVAAVEAAGIAIATTKLLAFDDGGSVDIIRDEDNMASDDVNALCTQQSIKAYVDSVGGETPPTYSFRAVPSANQEIAAATWTKLNLQTETWDDGGNFDNSDYRFIAPVAGYYFFTAWASVINLNAGHEVIFALKVNNTTYINGNIIRNWTGAVSYIGGGVSSHLQLAATDYVEFWIYITTAESVDKAYVHFSGHLVKDLT